MTVSIILMTHNNIGAAILETATSTLGELPLPTTAVTIGPNTDPDNLLPRLARLATLTDCGDGMLILTDMYGSTPSNIAQKLRYTDRVRIVSGLNLPMLIRVMNYPNLDVVQLAEKASEGGINGVVSD